MKPHLIAWRAVWAAAVITLNLPAADFVPLRAADGERTISGRPVAVVSLAGAGVVRIERKEGGEIEVGLEKFAAEERARLRRWMEMAAADPQLQLRRRLLAAKTPAILFVGNSYSFDVPQMFARIAGDEGRPVTVEQVTNGGWTLAQHAANPATIAKIKSRKWDVVVIQEQSLMPSFPAVQRDPQMLPAVKQLVAEIERNGALPALYQTWGRRDGDRENAAVFPDDTFAAMDARLAAGFAEARKIAPTLTAVPVGAAWAARTKQGDGPALYNPNDGSHPSAQGVYLAAAVFYTTFFNAEVKKAPDKIPAAAALNTLAARLGRYQPPPYPLP